jgi:hypothetical protein
VSSDQLLNKLKEASPNNRSFSLFISTVNEYSDLEVMNVARSLENELKIELKTCEVQRIGTSDGVFLSGYII